MKLRSLSALLAVGALIAACGPTPPSERAERAASARPESGLPAEPPAGDRPPLAPDFTLTGVNGQSVRLSDHRGRVVLVGFWATWCGPCAREIPSLKSLHAHYAKKGLVILGLSVDRDGEEPVRAFVRQNGMTWTNAFADDAVIESFGPIPVIPATFVIDRQGRIAHRFVGVQSEARLRAAIEPLL